MQLQYKLVFFNFYSRPCGRGDYISVEASSEVDGFLLTPLREGRRKCRLIVNADQCNFYSRPCGRGDVRIAEIYYSGREFLLTPLREGRQQFSTSPS